MRQLFAWVFRTCNAYIVSTRYSFIRKPLKVLFSISRYFSARSLRFSYGQPHWEVIHNFDHNIALKIDRSRTMGASFYWTGFHELREFIFLHRFLDKKMVAVDVGANQGEYSLFMAKRLTEGRVIAFEPLEPMRLQLNENIGLNDFASVIKVMPYGLSDREQVLPIFEVEDTHEGLSTLYLGGRKVRSTREVPLKRLDDLAGEIGFDRLDFIKIDIEGSELPALLGARQTIAKWRPYVMVEINDLTYKAAGYSGDDVSVFFDSLQYTPFEISKAGTLQSLAALPTFGNVVFVPKR